jgi:hypothetical protein
MRSLLLVLAVTQVAACNKSFQFTSDSKALGVDAPIFVLPDATVVLDTPIFPPADAAAPDVPAVPDTQPALPADTAAPAPDVAAVPDTQLPLPPDATAPDVTAVPDPQLPPPPDGPIADAMSDTRAPADLGAPDASTLCGVAASCSCSGTSCTCARQQHCDFSGVGCENTSGSCSLACNDGNDCDGQCQNHCSLSCTGGSTCALTMGPSSTAKCEGTGVTCVLTVGPGSTVGCDDHTNCSVTCTGSCKLSCDDTGSGSVCRLRCPGESAFVSGGGSCPRAPSSGDE